MPSFPSSCIFLALVSSLRESGTLAMQSSREHPATASQTCSHAVPSPPLSLSSNSITKHRLIPFPSGGQEIEPILGALVAINQPLARRPQRSTGILSSASRHWIRDPIVRSRPISPINSCPLARILHPPVLSFLLLPRRFLSRLIRSRFTAQVPAARISGTFRSVLPVRGKERDLDGSRSSFVSRREFHFFFSSSSSSAHPARASPRSLAAAR